MYFSPSGAGASILPQNIAGLESSAALITGVLNLQLTRYMHVTAMAGLYWNYLLTFNDELRFFWCGRTKWSIPQLLFLVNRYLPLVAGTFDCASVLSSSVTDTFCRASILNVLPWTGIPYVLTNQAFLLYCISALPFTGRRSVVLPLLGLYVVSAIVSTSIMAWSVTHMEVTSVVAPGVTGCIDAGPASIMYAFWIPFLIFDLVIFALAIKYYMCYYRQAFGHFVSCVGPTSWKLSGSRPSAGCNFTIPFGRTYTVLTRDPVIYGIVVFAVYLTNMMVFRFASFSLYLVGLGWAYTLSAVFGNRILINLRHTDTILHPGPSSLETSPELGFCGTFSGNEQHNSSSETGPLDGCRDNSPNNFKAQRCVGALADVDFEAGGTV